jgi:hypothetical protein
MKNDTTETISDADHHKAVHDNDVAGSAGSFVGGVGSGRRSVPLSNHISKDISAVDNGAQRHISDCANWTAPVSSLGSASAPDDNRVAPPPRSKPVRSPPVRPGTIAVTTPKLTQTSSDNPLMEKSSSSQASMSSSSTTAAAANIIPNELRDVGTAMKTPLDHGGGGGVAKPPRPPPVTGRNMLHSQTSEPDEESYGSSDGVADDNESTRL